MWYDALSEHKERSMGQLAVAIVSLLIGAVIGYVIAYFATAQKVRAEYEQRLSAAEAGAAAAGASLDAAKQANKDSEAALAALRSRLEQEQKARTKAETELAGERQRLEEQHRLLDEAASKLTAAFGDLAGQALRSNTEAFLRIATEKLGSVKNEATGELEHRKQAVEALVTPIRQSLEKVDSQIRALEQARSEAYGSLTAQVQSMATTQQRLEFETANLVKALRTPKGRGNWGEMQLRRVVELAGMTSYCDFAREVSVDTDDGRLRPDLIVKLPGGKNVVVDAKTPLKAYLDALEAGDDDSRAACMRDHARLVRDHISRLASKSYWEQFQPAPDFVVMFLPGETFFSAALEQDPSLIEQGVKQSVIVASPTTLIALLRAIAYGWRQETIAESAQEISALGADLYERLRVMADHFQDVGDGLTGAVKAYNAAVNSMESRVFSCARKFPELGTSVKKQIPELVPVDKDPQDLHARDWDPGARLTIAAEAEVPPRAKAQTTGQD